MRVWNRSMHVWDGGAAFAFAVSVCFVTWALSLAGWFGPDFTITIHPLQFSIDNQSILMTAAVFVPALYCFTAYPECRSSLMKFNAGWKVYLVAIAAGLILPFTSYFGTHHPEFPWGG